MSAPPRPHAPLSNRGKAAKERQNFGGMEHFIFLTHFFLWQINLNFYSFAGWTASCQKYIF
jgi:hypothetical protein